MTGASITMPFPARLKVSVQFDHVLLGLALALLLGGLVILASASISVSDGVAGRPFFYVERQLLAIAIGLAGAAFCLFVPMQVWQSLGKRLQYFILPVSVTDAAGGKKQHSIIRYLKSPSPCCTVS